MTKTTSRPPPPPLSPVSSVFISPDPGWPPRRRRRRRRRVLSVRLIYSICPFCSRDVVEGTEIGWANYGADVVRYSLGSSAKKKKIVRSFVYLRTYYVYVNKFTIPRFYCYLPRVATFQLPSPDSAKIYELTSA